MSNLKDDSKISIIKIIYEKNGPVHSICLLMDGRLASCFYNNVIKIYEMENEYNCDITVTNETTSTLLQLNNGKLITNSIGNSIKIWNISKYSLNLEHTIANVHESHINHFCQLTKDRFASSSQDSTIKIWDCNYPNHLIYILKGHSHSVYSLLQMKNKELLISSSSDFTLRIWNLFTYQCETMINSVQYSYNNTLIYLSDDKIIIGYYQTIDLIDLPSFEVKRNTIKLF